MAFLGNGERIQLLDDGLKWLEVKGEYPSERFYKEGLLLENIREGVVLIIKGLHCLKDNKFPSFGQCLQVSELLGNIKGEDGYRVPHFHDLSILLLEKVFSSEYEEGRAFYENHPNGAEYLKIKQEILNAAKGEQAARQKIDITSKQFEEMLESVLIDSTNSKK